jgi:hypothetical protein
VKRFGLAVRDGNSSRDLRARIVDNRDVGKKPVAAAGDGFDEPRILSRVA